MANINHSNLTSLFNDIANSIRGKTGDTNAIVADNFPNYIDNISTGSNTSDANATASDILSPKTAYVNGVKLTGTIATLNADNVTVSGKYINTQAGYYPTNVSKSVNTATHSAPVIDSTNTKFNTSSGNVEIRATHTQSTGYVDGNTTSVVGNVSIGLGSVSSSFNTTSGNFETTKGAGYIGSGSYNTEIGISTQTNSVSVSGPTVTGWVNGTNGYINEYNTKIEATVPDGTLDVTLYNRTTTSPSVQVSYVGNISDIGTTTKPSGNAGEDYYLIGLSNNVTPGSVKIRPQVEVTNNGYVSTANNTIGSWSNSSVYSAVYTPLNYYVNKGVLTNSNISGTAFLENTGDYGFRATVQVPEGYHAGETVTKDFTTGIFPAPESKATADKMLVGYSLYDEDGRLVTGNMPNQGAQSATLTSQGQQYTIPAGYHNGSGKVTASLTAGAYSASASNASVTPSVGGTVTSIATTTKPSGTDGTDFFTIDPGATATNGTATASVGTSGYLATGSKTANVQVTVGAGTNYYIPKSTATKSSSVSGKDVTATVTIPAGYNPGETVTVTNSVATTTHPDPAIDSTNTKFNTTSGNVEIRATHAQSTGYVTGNTTAVVGNVQVGLASINTPSGSAAQSTPTFSWDATNRKLTASVAQKTGTAYANVATAGYTASGQKSGTFTMTASSNSYTLDAAVLSKTAATSTTTSSGLVTNISNGAVNASDKILTVTGANGKYKISGTGGSGGKITAPGYIANNTEVSNSTSSAIYVNKATVSTTQPTATATAGTASVTLTNIASSSSATDYKIVATATGGSASTTAGSATVSEGYAPTATTASVSAKSASGATNTQTVYLKKATSSVTNQTVTGTTAGTAASATTSITGMETTSTNTGFIVSASASANSGAITGGTKTAYANITDGYSASAVNASAVATVSSVSAVTKSSSNTQYIKAATINGFSASSKQQSTPSVSINASNGLISATSAATSQDIYRNVTTGYVGTASTTKLTFSMTQSSAGTLQLTTKTGDGSNYQNNLTITPSASDQTIMNRNEFLVANHIIVKAAGSGPKGAISASDSSISGGSFTPTLTYNSTAGTYAYGGSKAASGTAYAKVTTVGYVDGGNNTSKALSATVSATGTLARTNITTAVSGDNRKPVIAVQATPSGVTNAANGAATTTKPSSGVYVTVASPANTATVTATISSATAGYSDGTNYIKTQGTKSLGAAASDTFYIPVNSASGNTQTGAATIGASSATANAITPTNVSLTDTATKYKLVSSANATSGAITAKTVEATAGPGYIASGTVKASATVSAVAAKTASDSKTKYLNELTLTGEANSVTVRGKTVTYNIRAYTSEGYTSSAITKWVNGTKSVADGVLGKYTTAASASMTSDGLYNYGNGGVNTSDKISLYTTTSPSTVNGYYRLTASGAGGAIVTTAGYIAKDVSNTSSTTYPYYVAKSNGTSISKSPYTNGTAQTAKISAGYLPSEITITWNGVAAATRSAGSASVLNNSNGNVRYYVNTTAGYTAANTTAYYLQLNTKAGGTTTVTTTETTLVNAGQFVTGAIKAKATAGTLAAGTAAVLNNSNGNVRYYRNVSAAGYIAANTTAYYLQLNTKGGGTTTVTGTETTLVNAGQFVTGAIKAKAQAASYNSSNFDLTYPGGIITIA